MTYAQAEWLRKLRDEGPQVAYRIGKTGYYCRTNGWSQWVPPFAHEVLDWREEITPKGLAALAEYEASK